MAAELRSVGLAVVERTGWETRSHGDFVDLAGIVWHHDASAKGDSPGVPAYMVRQWDAGNPSAHAWVSREGVWHLIGAGIAWHAGKVLPGRLHNGNSLGIETDHTVGEDWPPALLHSLRLGTAALLRHTSQHVLDFHKLICDPPGRKVDPAGLDITTERQAVAHALAPKPAPTPATKDANDVQLPTVSSSSPKRLVETVQSLLHLAGHPEVTVDGLYGKQSAGAVNAVRAAHHMPPGPVDAPVWRILLGLAA